MVHSLDFLLILKSAFTCLLYMHVSPAFVICVLMCNLEIVNEWFQLNQFWIKYWVVCSCASESVKNTIKLITICNKSRCNFIPCFFLLLQVFIKNIVWIIKNLIFLNFHNETSVVHYCLSRCTLKTTACDTTCCCLWLLAWHPFFCQYIGLVKRIGQRLIINKSPRLS